MIQALTNESVIYLEVEDLCLGFIRKPNGSICLLNGKSAVKLIRFTGDKVALQAIDMRNTLKKMDAGLDLAKEIYPEWQVDPVARGLIGKLEAKYKELEDLYMRANKNLEEISALYKDALKYDPDYKPSEEELDSIQKMLSSIFGKDVNFSKAPAAPAEGRPEAPQGSEGDYSGCGDCQICQEQPSCGTATGELTDSDLPPALLAFKRSLESKGGKVKIIAHNGTPEDLQSLFGGLPNTGKTLH